MEGENHEEVVANEQPVKNKGGRPKGSTNEAKSDAVKRKKLAMNDAALKMKRLKEEAAAAGKRVPRNGYTQILSDTSERFDLPDVLDYKSIESRLRPGRKVLVGNRGPVSPMVSVEAHVVDWILQLASMRQPVTSKMVLQLINSMVEGTEVKKQVIE